MDTTRAGSCRDVLARLHAFQEEAKRLEDFVLSLVEDAPHDGDAESAPPPSASAGSPAASTECPPEPTAALDPRAGEAPCGCDAAEGDPAPPPVAKPAVQPLASEGQAAPGPAAGPHGRGTPSAPVLADARSLTPDRAMALLCEVRRGLRADPVRALDLSYPAGLFAPGADPRAVQRVCLLHHSVHTARLAMYVADRHGYQPSTVEVVGLCALLHDIGMERVPAELYVKAGPLTAGELRSVRHHPSEGGDVLAASSDFGGLLHVIVPQVVRQHHERTDGSGYPDGVDAPDIHQFASLLALVEAYETMVSPRSYRAARLPYDAMETLLLEAFGKGRPAHFDKCVATSFLRALGLYPIGSGVELDTGESGQVVGANADAPDEPHVRLLWAPDGRRLSRPRVVDLRHVGQRVARPVRLPRPGHPSPQE